METRRRSRSKTPFLRSNCDHESCEHAGEEGHLHHKKKVVASSTMPKVQTIVEETVEVTSSSGASKIQKTSDYSSDDTSPHNRAKKLIELQQKQQQQQKQQSSHLSSTTTTYINNTTNYSSTTTTRSSAAPSVMSTKISKMVSNNMSSGGGAVATSTPKANYEFFASQLDNNSEVDARRRLNEIEQNNLNSQFEASQANKSRSFSRIFGNSSQEANMADTSDHLAYREYKRAGEYWKTTPKTDYTYSELSPHRRELAPGIIAMPNMSRRGLENHHERVAYMIGRDPLQEEYIRRRYAETRLATERLIYESGDELDVGAAYRTARTSQQWWFMRIITTVTTYFSELFGAGQSKSSKYNKYTYQSNLYASEQRGFFGTIWHYISRAHLYMMSCVYLFISSVLCLDTWLLRSNRTTSKAKKLFVLLLLLLLPLLLLGAWWYRVDEQERLHYVQRTQALLPLSLLASLKGAMHSSGATLRGLFQLPGLFSGDSASTNEAHLHKLQQNMQQALTPAEYDGILKHVNNYVQQLVDIKVQEQQRVLAQQALRISPEQTQLIVQIMRENLERLAREKRNVAGGAVQLSELSEADVQQLAQLVQVRLETSGWSQRPVQLSSENLGEIKRLISEQLELHSHTQYTLLVERIDLDALLARILAAPQLAKFIDARSSIVIGGKLADLRVDAGAMDAASTTAYEQQQQLINELNDEVAFIKLALSTKTSENVDFQKAISELQLVQADLLKRMQEYQLATDQRFSALLAEIDSKLATLKDEQFTLLHSQIRLSLVDILGFKQTTSSGAKLEDIDLQNWVRNMFVAKDYLEQRLLELNNKTNNILREEIDRSGMLLMRDIHERLKRELLLAVEAKQNETSDALKVKITTALSEDEVRKIVKSVLAIYDADKTGLVDFALESAGGQILSTRCTENFQTKSAQISVFGIPLWYPSNTPRVAISPNVQPGECWAFQGFPGFLMLKLNSLVYVTGFTLEHIPRTLSPNGRIDSAPRNFTVWGLEHEKDQDPILFGEYEYADNDASLQYFPVQNSNIKRPYEIVELRIDSNHGHPQYTCLYRFRVHGKPPAA